MVQLTAEHEASWPRIHACLQETLDALGEWNGVTSAPLADVFLTTSFNGSSLTGVESLRKHRATRRLLTWQPEAFRSRGGQFLQQVLLARQMRLQHALLVRLQGNSFCRGKEQVLSILRLFHERPDVGMVVSMGENEMIGDRTELNWTCRRQVLDFDGVAGARKAPTRPRRVLVPIGLGLLDTFAGGRRLVVHCRGGIGRAGTVASRLLVELGVATPEEALRRVRAARPGAVETWDQERCVERVGLSSVPLDCLLSSLHALDYANSAGERVAPC
eukprot:g31843.t1